jgi:hypothetical protein
LTFKTCTMCKHEWPAAADFEREGRTRPLGLVVDFDDPWETLVLFNDACGSTLAFRAAELRERLPPLDAELMAGQPLCPRRCSKFDDLEPCPNPCRNAPLRNYVARMIRGRAPHDEPAIVDSIPIVDSPPTASSQA